ncbi:MAG: hypothetical protein ACREEY_06540 [Brevundimonas sp.]
MVGDYVNLRLLNGDRPCHKLEYAIRSFRRPGLFMPRLAAAPVSEANALAYVIALPIVAFLVVCLAWPSVASRLKRRSRQRNNRYWR